MLYHNLQRWHNNKPTLGLRLVSNWIGWSEVIHFKIIIFFFFTIDILILNVINSQVYYIYSNTLVISFSFKTPGLLYSSLQIGLSYFFFLLSKSYLHGVSNCLKPWRIVSGIILCRKYNKPKKSLRVWHGHIHLLRNSSCRFATMYMMRHEIILFFEEIISTYTISSQ